MNLSENIMKNWVMLLPIVICLVFVILIIIEKYLVLQKSKVNVGSFTIKLRGLIKRKEITEAINYCTEEKSPIANILKKGLRKFKYGRNRIIEAFEIASKLEILKLEKNLSTLATLSKLTPFLGFLGAIVSLAFAYFKLQDTQIAVDLSILNNEIISAAVTSVSGILVGIIALVFHNIFVSTIKKSVFELEMVATEVIDVLDDTIPEFADINESDKEFEE